MSQADVTQTFSPEAEALLASIRAQGFPGWAFLTIPQGRGFMATLPALAGPSDFSGTVKDLQLSEQPEITARLYLPESVAPRRTLVYFHGGGFSLGQASDYDGCIRRLAHASGLAVLSVNYRLAPEHKYPAAVEDAYAAVQWMRQNAGRFDLNGEDLVVGGDSAGANLAAVVCLLCRDRQGPAIARQLLVSPLLDHGVVTESYRLFGQGPGPLTQRDIDWFLSHYLNREAELDDPSVSPLRATDLSGLPPAVIIAAALDPLRDDATRYAQRLQAVGVPVTLRVFPGMFHGFWIAPGVLPEAREAIDYAAAALRS